MTEWLDVSSTTPRIAYTATASQTAFTVPFVFFTDADLNVYQNTTLLTLGAHYSVSGAESGSGGTVTLVTGATLGDEILIHREIEIEQTTHIPPSGPLDIAAINFQFSKLIAIDQQNANSVDRSIHFPDSDSTTSAELPAATTRANKLLGFGTSGELIYPAGPTFVSGTYVGVADVDSRATAQVTTFGVSVNVVKTAGFSAPGDGGGAIYVRGAGHGSFTDGGGVTWSLDLLRGAPTVKCFGAVGNGVADDTAAMQAAHDTGYVVYYPAGRYLFAPTIEIASGGIIGDGPTQTILTSADLGTSNLIKYTGEWHSNAGSNAPTFHDFSMIGDPSKTNGAGVQLLSATGEVSYADFRNVHFAYIPLGIDFVAASLWKVIGCDFLAYTVAGIQVANTNEPDSGDSVITDCMFNNPYTTGSGVWQKSSGGLKIIGNKFLGGQRAITVNIEGTTSILNIIGNSIEGMTGACIGLSQGAVGATFGKITIVGNQFSGTTAIGTDASNFLYDVVISGNMLHMGVAGSNACIDLNSVTDFLIDGNVIVGNGGAGSRGLNIVACVNGKIGVNTYGSLPTPIAVSSSPTVEVIKDVQSGSSTTASSGWSGYGVVPGVLFSSPTTTVTFARPFLMTPSISDVMLTVGDTSGTVSASVATVSTTGFTYQAIGAQNGIASVINWTCRGVL